LSLPSPQRLLNQAQAGDRFDHQSGQNHPIVHHHGIAEIHTE